MGTGLRADLSEEDRGRASSLFVEYRTKLSSGDLDGAGDAIQSMIDELPGKAAEVAYREIFKDVETRLRAYQESATALLARDDPKALMRGSEVREKRKVITDILALGSEDAQKRRLAEEGWPALERLDALLLPNAKNLIARDPGLQLARDSISFRLDLCDDLAKHAELPATDDLRKRLVDFDVDSASLAAIASGADRRILGQNRKAAESAGVPQEAIDGVEDFNRIRILVGFPALSLDPLLCKAALNHSVDMKERNFFAHDSPVPGRLTPGDRAREVGTTASGENIHRGQSTGARANRGWFLSPGHFRNMFGGYSRVGMGGHQSFWTQKFGR